MKLTLVSPAKSLNKAFQKQRITRQQIDHFKANLLKLFKSINVEESEEHLKNIVTNFLRDTYYKDLHYINTKERTDLVIHNGKTPTDSVGVIIEAKRPGNKSEMVSKREANVKALHELILYYLRNRVDDENHEIKYLIATNIYEWFIFDAVWFEKNIYRNTKLIKDYEEWRVSGHDTKYFYENVAAKHLEAAEHDLSCTYFNLKEYEQVISDTRKQEDTQLVNLFKILSPEQLLKKPFANDSNSLNKEFYNELLHIVGLYENKDGGKYIIGRKPEKERNEGSLLESTIHNLRVRDRLKQVDNAAQYGETEDEQLFSIALELCLTWLNRILFLKLLEGQLISYHRGDIQCSFLNVKRTSNYDELNELFFEVLALPVEKRSPSVKEKFGDLPYLNSSLFEETLLENSTFVISELKERHEIPVYSGSILKGTNGKRITGTKNTLQYLFEFLDAYDYSNEGKDLIQEENKSIINASVLGLIFEKINGYKDGSYFTPGFITMYMCRETLRKAVVKKFQDSGIKAYQRIQTFDDLKDAIEYTDKEKRAKANDIINSVKVCDPAVGSGHFLVSALDELIAIKSDLRILNTRDGLRFKGYKIVVENDELIIVNEETDELFEYTLNKNSKPIEELQTLQEALFHEKQTLIENCLFGVDINPKSVMICRLRLWIELLKNSYYTKESKYQHLETLPNIDINIKCGNSLISRYDVQADLSDIFRNDKNLLSQYRIAVAAYKNSTSKEAKGELQNFINGFKENIINKFYNNHPLNHKLSKYKGQLALVENKAAVGNLFGKLLEKDIETDVKKLKTLIEKTGQEIEAVKSNRLYVHAFEWRFEFPEVLDDNGRFLGFDVVIGNPPYIRIEDIHWDYRRFYETIYKTAVGRFDLYSLFIEKVTQIKLPVGGFAFIVPGKFLNNKQFAVARKMICDKHGVTVVKIDDKVFDEAQVNSVIVENYLPIIISKSKYKAFNITTQELHPISETDIEIIMKDNEAIFRLEINTAFDALVAKIERDTLRIEEIGDVKDGIVAGVIKDILFVKKKIDKDSKKLYFGKHILKYHLCDTAVWVNYKPDQMMKEEVKRQGDKRAGLWMRDKEIFERDKIIYRKVGKELIATFGNKGIYYEQTVHSAHISDKRFKTKYVLALFNSKLFKFYYHKTNSQGGDIFPQVRISSVENLPIKLAEKSAQAVIEKLVNKILEKKQKSPTADTTALEHQIDELVYKIYRLTEEEIKIVEGRL
jgi:adenine-specific DNA-methyltransferase